MKTLLLALVFALLSGCSALVPQEEAWQARASLPALPVSYAQVAKAELPRVCGNHPGMKLYGCARRDFKARTCIIYTAAAPAEWLLDHERKHCAGFDHADDREKLLTAAVVPQPQSL